MEKKDERIANLERLLGKREFELDWLSKKQGVGTVAQRRQLLDTNGDAEANEMKAKWLEYYNRERPHSSLHNKSPLQYREESGNTLAANFWRDFSAPAGLAAIRAAPSLRSGRPAYATKSRQKWIDIRERRVI